MIHFHGGPLDGTIRNDHVTGPAVCHNVILPDYGLACAMYEYIDLWPDSDAPHSEYSGRVRFLGYFANSYSTKRVAENRKPKTRRNQKRHQ